MRPNPFSLHVSDVEIDDLRVRLARTRFPDQAPGAHWAYGTDLTYMRTLVSYWRDKFDWRTWEARLNGFPQFKVSLHDIDLHFLHVPGVGPDPKPLLLLHGWPGSVFEFVDVIPRLIDPVRFGGDAADAFTVVAPSLPGYGLSFRPNQKRFGIYDMADCFADLMTTVLGYRKFGAQGGDWGAFTCSNLGARHADKLGGIHLNMLSLRPDGPLPTEPTVEEERYGEEIRAWAKEETGYIQIQGTRPQNELRVCAVRSRRRSSVGRTRGVGQRVALWRFHQGRPAAGLISAAQPWRPAWNDRGIAVGSGGFGMIGSVARSKVGAFDCVIDRGFPWRAEARSGKTERGRWRYTQLVMAPWPAAACAARACG
jgi:pimeloyl-ACP methyl ester carboxylesterase